MHDGWIACFSSRTCFYEHVTNARYGIRRVTISWMLQCPSSAFMIINSSLWHLSLLACALCSFTIILAILFFLRSELNFVRFIFENGSFLQLHKWLIRIRTIDSSSSIHSFILDAHSDDISIEMIHGCSLKIDGSQWLLRLLIVMMIGDWWLWMSRTRDCQEKRKSNTHTHTNYMLGDCDLNDFVITLFTDTLLLYIYKIVLNSKSGLRYLEISFYKSSTSIP